MDYIIRINADNAAFDDAPGFEVARILRRLADKVEGGQQAGFLYDINGNTVGHLTVIHDGEDEGEDEGDEL
jgi:hypothetical protein